MKRLRRVRRWSQAALAKRLGISQPQLSQVERGRASLTAEQLLDVFSIFNVSVTEFLPSDPAAQLQNALVRLGAAHLVSRVDVVVREELSDVNEAIRQALIHATPRLVTALGPVILANTDQLHLTLVHAKLAETRLQHRLGWLVDNLQYALERVPPRTREEARRYRRVQLLFGEYLRRAPNQPLESRDLFGATIRSERTVTEVSRAASAVSRRWGIVTRIQEEDFEHALGAAREAA